jgi:hypothetical protein
VRLSGARIRLAERPRLGATTKRDRSYDLAAPGHAALTPYISAPGYHSIFLCRPSGPTVRIFGA